MEKLSNRPDLGEWGWEWNADSQSWLPLWTTLPIASKACLELIKCSLRARVAVGIDVAVKELIGHAQDSVTVIVTDKLISIISKK